MSSCRREAWMSTSRGDHRDVAQSARLKAIRRRLPKADLAFVHKSGKSQCPARYSQLKLVFKLYATNGIRSAAESKERFMRPHSLAYWNIIFMRPLSFSCDGAFKAVFCFLAFGLATPSQATCNPNGTYAPGGWLAACRRGLTAAPTCQRRQSRMAPPSCANTAVLTLPVWPSRIASSLPSRSHSRAVLSAEAVRMRPPALLGPLASGSNLTLGVPV
jgi:hypothetical protein